MANLSINPFRYQPTINQAPVVTDHGARVELIKNGFCPDCGSQMRKKTRLGKWKTLYEVCPRIESHPTNAFGSQPPPVAALALPMASSTTQPISMTSDLQLIQQSSPNTSSAIYSSIPTMTTANTVELSPSPPCPLASQAHPAEASTGQLLSADAVAVCTTVTPPTQPNLKQVQSSDIASSTASVSIPTTTATSQVHRKRFCDGGVWGKYVGELDANGLRSGRGEMKWEDGEMYHGEWKDDNRDGRGTCRFDSGDVYEGEWKEGKADGQGTYRYASGNVYEGEWKNDTAEGRGTCRFADGNAYEGEWKDDKPNGQGTYRWADGSVYEGEYKNNKKDGQGSYQFASGSVYEGEWKDDKMDGQGTYRWADGQVYEGEYKNDTRDGRGTYRWPNGCLDVSMFKADQDSGEGVRWSKDRRTTWLLKDGKIVRKIVPSEAKAVAKRIGFLDVPL